MPPKKIILISLDTLRADHLGCYGYPRNTSPTLDTLAKQGILFKNAFSPSSHTIPAHGSIFTGKYPSKHTIGFNQNIFVETGKLNTDIDTTLAEVLKNCDLKTAAFISGIVLGKNTNFNAGFESYDDKIGDDPYGRRKCTDTNQNVLNWLTDNFAQNFFLFIHYFDIHGPYNCEEKYQKLFLNDSNYKKSPIPHKYSGPNPERNTIPEYQLLDVKRDRQNRIIDFETDLGYYIAQYDGCIRYLDDNLGLLFDKLQQLGIYDDTLIIVTSDHGEAFGENDVYFYHGLTVTREQILVPLIIKPHKDWAVKSGIINTPVSTLDIMPTLLDLCKSTYDDPIIQGRSLITYIEGRNDPPLQDRILMSENERQYTLIYPNHIMELFKKETPSSTFYPFIPEIIDSLNGKKMYWDSGREYTFSLIFDQYQRYKLVSDIINKFRNKGESFKILEAGAGFEENLKKFLSTDNIYYIDKAYPSEYLQKGNFIVGDILKTELTEKYDFVVAIDVYEHIPQIDREKFVDTLINSSKIAAIIAAPFDQENVKNCEFFANEVYKMSHGSDYIWLKEHIANGLPSLSLTIDLVKDYGLNPVIIPNGYLPRWFEMISTFLLTEGKPEFSQMITTLYEFYNQNYYQYDNRDPAYRQVIIIPKGESNIDFSDLLSKNVDSEGLTDNNQLLESFIKNINRSYQINEKSQSRAIILKNEQLAELSHNIQSLEQVSTAKDEQLAELSHNIQDLSARLNDREQELSSLENSIIWQFTMKFHSKIIERLLPYNTRRRRYYNLGLNGGKILINDGWDSFWWNFNGYLRGRKLNRQIRKNVQNPQHFRIMEIFSKKIQLPQDSLGFLQIMDTIPNPNNFSDLTNIEKLKFTQPAAPIVSIIIPVYNKWQYTYNCLKSILENTEDIPYEIIIANDCSTDSTDEMLKKIEGIKAIKNEHNLGYLKNCNNAVNLANGQYVLYLNNDTYVKKGWLESLLEPVIKNDNVAIVGPNIISTEGKLLENGWIIGIDGWGLPIGRGDDPSKYEYNYLKEVDCVTGACLLIKKEVFMKAGLFDERFSPAYYEEFDFAFSVKKLGYKVVVQPKAQVIHYDNSSYGKDTRDRLSVNNHQKFMDRWSGILKNRPKRYYDYFFARDNLCGENVILIIDDKVPDYDKYAGSLMMYQYVKLFHEMGFKVIFLPDNLERMEPYTQELQQLGIEVIYGTYDFDSWIQNNGKYLDIILLSRPLVSIKYIDKIKANSKAKILYCMHDLHYLRELRRYEIEKYDHILKESQKLKEIEFRLFTKADILLTFSNVEARIISNEFPNLRNIEVIPLFVYDDFLAYSSLPPFDERQNLIFLGGFGHLPNVDAVLWFVKECFPTILAQNPNIKFLIIGSNPPQNIKNLASENIIVTGQIKDLKPYFEKARVFVSPLRYGAGVKGKLVTSMYYGVPIVTTTIGAEGLGIIDKENALVTDDPDDFASKVIELYSKKGLWEKLSVNGLKQVKNSFSKQEVSKKILNVLKLHKCHICGSLYEFPASNDTNNLRETTLCPKCGAIKRWDDVARVLLDEMGTNAFCLRDAQQNLKKFSIYLNESWGPIYDLLSKSPNFECSELWDDVPTGTMKNNIRCEDVTALTYPNETFDIVISQDVFEHVSVPEKGFSEIYRVLKPGGYFIFTVPLDKSLSQTRQRARINNGKVEYLLPPVYHGDMLRAKGSLVFSDFGMDIIEMLKNIGFEVATFEENHSEYSGGYNIVFSCKRKLSTPTINNKITEPALKGATTNDNEGLICLHPFYSMCIFQNYNIYNCVCLDWIKQSIGDLKTNSLYECWNSEIARYIRRKMYSGEWQDICNPICPIIIEYVHSHKLIKYEDLDTIEALTPALIAEIRARKDHLKSPPTLFKLDNSNVCNLHCIMCSREVFKDNPLLQKKLMTDLQNYLPSAKKLILCGVGDPLARPDTRDILMNHKGSIKFDIISNGLLLPKYWDKIKHQKFGTLIISVDAATKETYEKIRAGGRWENLLQSLSLIKKNSGAFEDIIINMTVMRSNYKEIPLFIDLAESYGFNVLFHGIRGAYPDENIFEPKDLDAINELKRIVVNESNKKRSINVSLDEIVIYLNYE